MRELFSILFSAPVCSGGTADRDSDGGICINHNKKAVEITTFKLDKSEFMLYSIYQRGKGADVHLIIRSGMFLAPFSVRYAFAVAGAH